VIFSHIPKFENLGCDKTTLRINSPGGGTGAGTTPVSIGSCGWGTAWLAPRATMVCGGSAIPTHRGGEVVGWLPMASGGGQNRGPVAATL
jgi:hypothetical protein